MSSKELIEQGLDAWNGRDRAAFVAGYAENCVLTTPDGTGKGHEAVGAFYDMNMTAFPDNQVRLRTVAYDGAVIAEEGVFSGTNTPAGDARRVAGTGHRRGRRGRVRVDPHRARRPDRRDPHVLGPARDARPARPAPAAVAH